MACVMLLLRGCGRVGVEQDLFMGSVYVNYSGNGTRREAGR
jgi:hypothetical protein